MNHSHDLLERLSAAQRADRMRDADRWRLLSQRRERSLEGAAGVGVGAALRAPRIWLADVLLRLAARLSPAHRDLLRALRASSACAPRAN